MIEPYVLLILALAVARMCVLMVDDDITEFIRVAVGRRYGTEHLLFRGVTCHWCWGIWWSAGMTTVTYLSAGTPFQNFWYAILTFLAVAHVGSYIASR